MARQRFIECTIKASKRRCMINVKRIENVFDAEDGCYIMYVDGNRDLVLESYEAVSDCLADDLCDVSAAIDWRTDNVD